MNKPLVICFAGATASGKSQLACALSEEYGLPIFSNDSVRQDAKVLHDAVDLNNDATLHTYLESRDERLEAMFERGRSFIYDASVDRRWADLKAKISQNNFDYVLISFDLSEAKILRQAKMFDRPEHETELRLLCKDHATFSKLHGADVSVCIDDSTYDKRLETVLELIDERL